MIQFPLNTSPKKVVLLSVINSQEGYALHYTFLQKGKPSSATFEVSDLAELIKKTGKQHPFIIHFSGFGVLTRIVENAPNYKESLIVTGNEEDFYFNSISTKGTIGVSFIRKNLIEGILTDLNNQKCFVFGVYLGPIPVISDLSENQTIQVDFDITLKNGTLTQLEKATTSNYNSLDHRYVSAFNTICFNELENLSQGLSAEVITQTKTNFREFKRFVKLGISLLSFFLIALVGNYFYVNHLNQKAAEMEAEIASFGDNLSLMERFTQEKQRKLILIDNSGIQTSKYISAYLDEIGASVPNNIELSKLISFPLTEPLKPKRKVEVQNDKIELFGFTKNSKILDDWIEVLQKKPWVSSVEMINYTRLDDNQSTFHFILKLTK